MPQAPIKTKPGRKPKAKPEHLTVILPEPTLDTLPPTPVPRLNKAQTINLMLARMIQLRDQDITEDMAKLPALQADAEAALQKLLELCSLTDYLPLFNNNAPPNKATADYSLNHHQKTISITLRFPVNKFLFRPLHALEAFRPAKRYTDWELDQAKRKFQRQIMDAEVAKLKLHLKNPAVLSALDDCIKK